MQLTCRDEHIQKKQSLSSGSHNKIDIIKKFLDSLMSNTMIHSLLVLNLYSGVVYNAIFLHSHCLKCRNKITGTTLTPHPPSTCHYYACSVVAADVARVNNYTFTVVREVEQKGLEAAGVWSELVPDDFTEQDDGDVVLHLKRTHVQIYYERMILYKCTLVLIGQ